MALKTYTWISLWFVITVPIIFWDVGYCFMRPRSMEGGDLHWIWRPYALYQKVSGVSQSEAGLMTDKPRLSKNKIDYVYGLPAFESGDGFTNAQSSLNVVETLLNIAYVYLAHVARWPPATVIGFGSALMTLSKTILYWAQEYFCGFCAIGHNNTRDIFILWILPNGLWIIIPTLIVWRLGKDLVDTINFAERQATKASSEKSK
ncbi:hypothetical protein NLJ89_g6345 [Agrocybe chaxingu]|uniref:EXPERA domain-containing protein n=1 Tax=Agrocybe chaxingu TaxID=84603 RepID=A0A9W8JZB3_9AGAR|nr:hypothetical protein NLJ89_g6345 [Agrocybe chaxingu]